MLFYENNKGTKIQIHMEGCENMQQKNNYINFFDRNNFIDIFSFYFKNTLI